MHVVGAAVEALEAIDFTLEGRFNLRCVVFPLIKITCKQDPCINHYLSFTHGWLITKSKVTTVNTSNDDWKVNIDISISFFPIRIRILRNKWMPKY